MAEPVKLALDDATASRVAGALQLEGFFPEFSVEHLAKVFPRSGLYAFPDEAHIIAQGASGADVFIICSGEVRIVKELGSAVAEVARLGPGDIVGEIALLTDGVRTASAVAAGETRVFSLVSADIQYILANNRELAEHLKKLVAERLGK